MKHLRLHDAMFAVTTGSLTSLLAAKLSADMESHKARIAIVAGTGLAAATGYWLASDRYQIYADEIKEEIIRKSTES